MSKPKTFEELGATGGVYRLVGGVSPQTVPEYREVLTATQDINAGEIVFNEEPLAEFPTQWDQSSASEFENVPFNLVHHVMILHKVFTVLSTEVQKAILELPCAIKAESVSSLPRETKPFVESLQAAVAWVSENACQAGGWAEKFDQPTMLQYLITIEHNAYRFQENSRAVFKLSGRVRHSCSPNTVWAALDGKLRFVAIRHIEKDEFITTNRVPATHALPTARRRQQLLLSLATPSACSCSRCVGESDRMRSIPCPHCHRRARGSEDPVLPAEVALESTPESTPVEVHYVVPIAEEDASELKDQDLRWLCPNCKRSFDDTGLGFDLELEHKLEENILAVEKQMNEFQYDDLSRWYMAILKMLGRRHWSGARVLEMQCHFLENALRSGAGKLAADQRELFLDELREVLLTFWRWFCNVELSPIHHGRLFVRCCATLVALTPDLTILSQELLGICAGALYPGLLALWGPGSDEARMAEMLMKRFTPLKEVSLPDNATPLRNFLRERGNAQFSLGAKNGIRHYREALMWYTQALLLSPTSIELYSNRSAANLNVGNASAALIDGFRCATLNPEWPKGYYRLALAHLALDQTDKARQAAQMGLLLQPGNLAFEDLVTKLTKDEGGGRIDEGGQTSGGSSGGKGTVGGGGRGGAGAGGGILGSSGGDFDDGTGIKSKWKKKGR